MFTEQERSTLKELLGKAAVPKDALTVDGVHGLLCGLAFSPDLVMPSEWLPLVFGKDMAVFDSKNQAGEMISTLLSSYNRLLKEAEKGKALFPFTLQDMELKDFSRVREWCLGLVRVLCIAPDMWGISEHEPLLASQTEEDRELSASIGIITGIVFPEEVTDIFTATADDERSRDELDLHAGLYSHLPQAVEFLQRYGTKLRKTGFIQRPVQEPLRSEKVGRNDPCPCNSGKKYKKCCGA